jgi:hypothetical protein
MDLNRKFSIFLGTVLSQFKRIFSVLAKKLSTLTFIQVENMQRNSAIIVIT